MKKTVGLFILASIAVVLVSCKEKSCGYAQMEYNPGTKQCDCIQFLDSENAPELKKNDYNSVLAVNQNFYYASVENKDYPYHSHEGDTIMFYGNVDRMEFSYPDSTWVRFYVTNGNNYGPGSHLTAECPTTIFESIDKTMTCYVTGTLAFGLRSEHFEYVGDVPEPGQCGSTSIRFDVIDIHN